MVSRKRNGYGKCCLNRSLIAANKIKPEIWRLSVVDVIKALKAQGYDVKKIKKINYLKHQVCISYWDNQGGVCSGFFSYRILPRWQFAVQKLIHDCKNITELQNLTPLIEYEFCHYPYPWAMQEAINQSMEDWGCELTANRNYGHQRYPNVANANQNLVVIA